MKLIMRYLTFSALFCALQPNLNASEPSATPTMAQTMIKRSPLPQTSVGTCTGLTEVLRWGSSDIQYSNGDLTIQGFDGLGRHYSFVTGTGIAGCKVWSADLDGNGVLDLEILVQGMDSSGGDDTTLTVLLFDKAGRPFSWQATGKFTEGSKGIEQVVAGNARSQGYVMVLTNEGIPGDPNRVFELYKFSSGADMKVDNGPSGTKWPAIEHPTPAAIKNHSFTSITFDVADPVKYSEIVSSSVSEITGATMLRLASGEQIKPPLMLVQNSADGSRSINADPTPDDIKNLLQTTPASPR